MTPRAIYTFPQVPETVRLNSSDLHFIKHTLPLEFLEYRVENSETLDKDGIIHWQKKFVKALKDSSDWVSITVLFVLMITIQVISKDILIPLWFMFCTGMESSFNMAAETFVDVIWLRFLEDDVKVQRKLLEAQKACIGADVSTHESSTSDYLLPLTCPTSSSLY